MVLIIANHEYELHAGALTGEQDRKQSAGHDIHIRLNGNHRPVSLLPSVQEHLVHFLRLVTDSVISPASVF